MISNSNLTRVRLSLILINNLCILVFQLSKFNLVLYISHLVYSHIKLYFPEESLENNINLIKVEINTGIKEFKAQMNKLSQQLLQYAFLTTL